MILDWAAAEGWNPGLDDADPFWTADPGGYFLAELAGRPAAAVSMVRYGDGFAFLGFYIAHPDFRGQGIGRALWQHAVAAAGPRTIGLDGVVAQQENYRRSGFAYTHGNMRYGGRLRTEPVRDKRVIPVAPVHMPMIVDYDARFNPAPRPAFIGQWARETETRRSLVLIDDGTIAGLGTIRACRGGRKIGPLFADTAMNADLLFRALVMEAGAGDVYLDIPVPNGEAKALCARHGLEPVFETARMYRGEAPGLPLDRIFGITTFELG
ncbi:GNAT family N-acetyltransferase [Rhizobium sp. TRM95111]|uniref:GNAT family N-acetyltransferase n=1 Tax=Rhizobium alarense TaxID=2846851 RepID=UPI001F184D12|nr:GNAT family N-acetyltransferase [Rhizobium alarense]MCF3641503.1 GNAT family N-acetyltransferase [Rhizobium alarense]